MRIPLILFGIITFLTGIVFSVLSLSSVSDAEAKLMIAEAGGAESRIESAEDRIETWEGRRNIGFGAIAIGAVVALVGFATPRTQQVEIMESASGRGATPVEPTSGARDHSEGSAYQARLQTLKELHTGGVLSDAEYESQRKSIIDSI